MTRMATAAVLDVGARRAASSCLVVALLTSACAISGPRATPPETGSASDQATCEDLAGKTEARIQGGSVLAGAGMGAAVGTLGGAALLAMSRISEDADHVAGIAGVAIGAGAAIGGLIGAIYVVAKNAGTRTAAYDEAMNACRRPALLTRELGPEHPEVAQSLHALAYRYHRLAELAKAESLYGQALTIQERTLGVDASEVATILDDYAALLRQTGRIAEARVLEERAAAIRAKR